MQDEMKPYYARFVITAELERRLRVVADKTGLRYNDVARQALAVGILALADARGIDLGIDMGGLTGRPSEE